MGTTAWADGFSLLRERVRALHEQIARQATAGLLLPNFSDAADGPTPEQLGADHAARLRTVRRLHDPAGVFGGQGGR